MESWASVPRAAAALLHTWGEPAASLLTRRAHAQGAMAVTVARCG
eukprot:CAMPEP_0170427266 /NCGR_PEP_ID=MMETSP0117_2-20130122/39125_1 /TAXON_ID=400756 /ORGANISM="Durinskia baltica, Strain CSIRO CS-38" /LENGTH=44 /DNA_ID= /DNA_START= /DNA_END= /DNA_ORIENTATION=